MPYVILTDAACDVDGSILKQADIGFIPMEYSLGNEMRSCAPPELPTILKAFYDSQRKGDLTKTTQISPLKYEAAMIPWLEKGYSVLYLVLSSGLSSTFDTAVAACGNLGHRYPSATILPLDTRAATGGMGILLERAVRNRKNGMGIRENAADLKETIPYLRHWFLVQDFQYLQRGGRVGAAAAAVGTVFHIRPILRIDESGALLVIGRTRGNHQAMRELIDHYEENRREGASDPVYIVDADALEIGERMKEKLLERHPDLTIRRCTLSPIIGAHTGPGMAAIIHVGKDPA